MLLESYHVTHSVPTLSKPNPPIKDSSDPAPMVAISTLAHWEVLTVGMGRELPLSE